MQIVSFERFKRFDFKIVLLDLAVNYLSEVAEKVSNMVMVHAYGAVFLSGAPLLPTHQLGRRDQPTAAPAFRADTDE